MTAVPHASRSDEADGGKFLKPDAGAKGEERYLLQCLYCDWSTLDVDLVFHRPTKMTEQLAKHRKARIANANGNASVLKEIGQPLLRSFGRSLAKPHLAAGGPQ